MEKWKRLLAALAAVGILCLTGCGGGKGTPPEGEAPSEPIVIHLYGSLDETYLPFLEELSQRFPEVELRYEYQWDKACEGELERRILHGAGPDLAVVSGASLQSLTEKNLLLDLTGEKFSTRYHVSFMNNLNDQGRVLALPLPNDLRCLVCNRGILKENGIEEAPRTLYELLESCKTLSERGQGAIIADEGLYGMLLGTSFLCRPEGYDWSRAYNEGVGTMVGTPAEASWEWMAELAAVSGCSEDDALATPARRTELIMEGKYVFRVTNLINLKHMNSRDPELDVVALPMLGETEEDQWVFYASQKSVRYFVANATLAEPANAAKQAVVIEMLDWISTQEGQQLLADCGSSAFSYVNDVDLEQEVTEEYLDSVIEKGRLTTSDYLERDLNTVISSCAARMADGGLKPEEAVRACDAQNAAYVPPEAQSGLDEVIGVSTDHVYWRKPAAVTVGSSMAQLGAKAMAEAFPEADFAFVMAKNVASSLYPGEITLGDALVCANGEGDSELMLVQATGAQIRALIDAGVGTAEPATFIIPYGVAGKGRLIYPVGLTYRADVTREAGDKVTELTLAGGGELEPDRTYAVVVSRLLVDGVTEPNLKDCPVTPTGRYLRDVLVDYIRAHGEISPPEPGFEISGNAPAYTFPQ